MFEFGLAAIDPDDGMLLPHSSSKSIELAQASNLNWEAAFFFEGTEVGIVTSCEAQPTDSPILARRLTFSPFNSDVPAVSALIGADYPPELFEELVGKLVAEHLTQPFSAYERAVLSAQRHRALNFTCFLLEGGNHEALTLIDDVLPQAIGVSTVQGAALEEFITSMRWDKREDYSATSWAAYLAWTDLPELLDGASITSDELFRFFAFNELPAMLSYRDYLRRDAAPVLPEELEEFPIHMHVDFFKGNLTANPVPVHERQPFADFGDEPFTSHDEDGHCLPCSPQPPADFYWITTAFDEDGEPLAVISSQVSRFTHVPRQDIRITWPQGHRTPLTIQARFAGKENESLIRGLLEFETHQVLTTDENLAFQLKKFESFIEFLEESEDLFLDRNDASYEPTLEAAQAALETLKACRLSTSREALAPALDAAEEAWLEVRTDLIHTDVNALTAAGAQEMWQAMELYAHVSYRQMLFP